MAYKIIVSPNAQKEIEDAIDYYALHSIDTPSHFINAIKESYYALSVNPLFRVRYKNIRAINLKNFPFSLYYIISEENQIVRILSCFHNKRNPLKRPLYKKNIKKLV